MPKKTDRRYWLVKSEPSCFSFDDLRAAPERTTCWSGVRNFQARNFMRDDMKPGDGVLYYHSSAEPAGIVGTAEVVKAGYPDHTAWDQKDEHFDPRSTKAAPVWYMVDIKAGKPFPRLLALAELRKIPALDGMELLKRGSRLSVQPVTEREWNAILELAASD